MVTANRLEGSIPVSVKDLTRLRVLDLAHNSFSGTLPEEVGRMENLGTIISFLSCCFLFFFVSSMPPLCSSVSCNLVDNELRGTIPTDFGELAELGKSLTVSSGYVRRVSSLTPSFPCKDCWISGTMN